MAFVVPSLLPAQSIRGIVCDENGTGIASALVRIPALHRSLLTDTGGSFVFSGILPGRYVVEAQRVGHIRSATAAEASKDNPALVRLTLVASPLEIPAVTITAESQPTRWIDASLQADGIDGRELQSRRGQSLGATIAELPGVSSLSGSPLAVKPVIRGLSGQRTLVLADGLRLESQTWDEPQSPEIDVLDIDRIEVIRGPGSVLYGSDALGGVLNAIRPVPPCAEDGAPALRGSVLANLFTNSIQGAGAVSVEGASGAFGYRANVSARSAGDYNTPAGTVASGARVAAGRVFNSGASEINGSLSGTWRQPWGTLSIDAVHFLQTYYIAPEPGRKEYELNVNTMLYDSIPASPKQEILHERAALTASIPSALGRLEISAGGQYNSRREEGVNESEADEQKKEKLGIKPEAQLVLMSGSVDGRLHHLPVGPIEGTLGISTAYQTNATEGMKAIIPGYATWSIAGYVYEVYPATSSLRLTGGIRLDHRSMAVESNAQLNIGAQTIVFSSLSGTAGAAFEVAPPLTLALNIGRGWRAPVAAELFFNGADEGTVRYKVGDPHLVPEHSFNLDLSLRFRSPSVSAEVSVYRNRIDRFIFLAPNGQVNSGLAVYQYEQADATLQGGEFSTQVVVTPWMVVEAGLDVVRGTNEESQSPLPLMPPDRIRAGVRIVPGDLGGVREAFVRLCSRTERTQDRIDRLESSTPGYTVLDLYLGGKVSVVGVDCTIDLAVTNLFDKAYFDHLSRYKNYALDPGRDIVVRVGVPFGLL